MTGILQAYARKHLKAIDFLKFKFKIMDNLESENQDLNHFDEVDKIGEAPSDGVLIYGLYIEGATWSRESHILEEQLPAVMIAKMPVIHLEPYEVQHKKVVQDFKPQATSNNGDLSNSFTRRSTTSKHKGPKPLRTSERKAEEEEQKEAATGDPNMEGEADVYLDNPNFYPCPVYKTSTRSGVLSTTGQSTNFILNVSLPIDPKARGSGHWTLRGAAMITMLDD